MHTTHEDEDHDAIYKDVVVIGNGPSGICLSYMFAGNWPYYTGESHPGDEMLTARLRFSTKSSNVKEEREIEDVVPVIKPPKDRKDDGTGTNKNNRRQLKKQQSVDWKSRGLAYSTRSKLEYLSSGIEGRSGGRPLALLMDQLQHPCVDAGLDLPSLLVWRSRKHNPEHRIIDHVVLGKGQPGGAWQTMDPNVLTISLSRWMSLPDLDIRQWELLVEAEHLRKTNAGESERYLSQEKISAFKPPTRASVGTVAAYYKDYVRRKNLEKYFRCGTVVTSVRPVTTVKDNLDEYGWIVEGFDKYNGKRFRYRCKRAILATGTTDFSNCLGLPGEKTESSWVTHNLNDLEVQLDEITREKGNESTARIKPVLVVGAGLSAADAIVAARFHGIPVLHAFRDSANGWSKQRSGKVNSSYDRLQWLPSSMYPEYHKVYEMMADGGNNYPLYKALPGYTLVDLTSGNDNDLYNQRRVILCSPSGQPQSFEVSIVAILIGYKPDLSYLDSDGIGLGKYPEKPIDNKSNPIEVDNITYEVIGAPRKGLYALGPLVGDNFVRFIVGGAFGILAHILTSSAT